MNDIIETIPQAGENRKNSEIRLATVAEVLTNGLKLRFDGSNAATSKIYKCNSACSFSVGDRVKVTKCSGTYVVDYVIGGPSSGGGGGTTNYNDLNNKPSISGVTLSGNKTPAQLGIHSIPAGGSTGQVLKKRTNTSYDADWAEESGGGGGTTDYDDLTDKPSINGITLAGNKVTADLKINLSPNSAFAIPAENSTGVYDMPGLTAAHEVALWNFSVSAENCPPADLECNTYNGYFTITNNGGTTSETIKPVFVVPTDVLYISH